MGPLNDRIRVFHTVRHQQAENRQRDITPKHHQASLRTSRQEVRVVFPPVQIRSRSGPAWRGPAAAWFPSVPSLGSPSPSRLRCSVKFSFVQVQLRTVRSTKFLLHVNILIFLFFSFLFVFFFQLLYFVIIIIIIIISFLFFSL